MTMPGENDFISCFGTTHQFCKLALCVSYGYLHGDFPNFVSV
ncbi:hypothetical protein Agau_C200854 [Agrobacterium tumefaciens F2]|nr:hypothetical protein Agau_C200854 [Agrobacterium tumefaciens F2]